MSNASFINKVHAAWMTVLVMYGTIKYNFVGGGGGEPENGWLKGVTIIKECPDMIKRNCNTA